MPSIPQKDAESHSYRLYREGQCPICQEPLFVLIDQTINKVLIHHQCMECGYVRPQLPTAAKES